MNSRFPSQLLLINMLVAGEDHRYRLHTGFDVIAICRALFKNVFYHHCEGASTIEQQLVRTRSGNYDRTIKRKIVEIIEAVKLFYKEDRKQIAWEYLECAYYGTRYRSLSQILDKFGYTIMDDIPLEVCAEVIARLKYPEPRVMSDKRQKQIARRKDYIIRLYKKYKYTGLLWIE